MGHLQSTMKRIEDEELPANVVAVVIESDPLAQPVAPQSKTFEVPGIGTSVQFRLRGGEWRNGQNAFAAIVTKSNPDDGTVNLLVVFGADDFMEQQSVPQLVGDGDWGWSMLDSSAGAGIAKLRAEFKAFKAELAAVILGGWEIRKESIYDVLQEHDNRLSLLASGNAPDPVSPRRRRRQRD